MALHTEEIRETSGNRKKINAGAYSMVFDNLQRSNYKYPIKSTVRELACNGIDAIKERNNAIAILTGKAQISDFYYVPGTNPELDESMAQNPGMYSDSKWDPSYYSLEHLEKNRNKVTIQYQENSVLNRDLLIVTDSGVGLGGSRLEGYFDLAFSTKRLNQSFLGKFGLGSKVPLSTRVPYFTVVSKYNGRETIFNVYSEHYEGVLSQTNLETGEVHQKHMMSDEANNYVYYSRKTAEPNGTQIRVEIKKHHKDEVLLAVQNQLLYFPDVSLELLDEHGGLKEELVVQANILYEDDKIIISDNTQFSKPHIVINNVSYGYLDCREMEIEEKNGNVGIKVAPGEVEVTHSREDVIWSEITKNTILERFSQVREIAGDFINRHLVETDYLKWVSLCQNVMTQSTHSGTSKEAKIMRAFSGVIQMHDVTMKYSVDPKIKYSNSVSIMAKYCGVDKINRIQVRKGENMVQKINRQNSTTGEKSVNWDVNAQPILVKEDRYSFRKDMYLTSIYPEGYIVVSKPKMDEEDMSEKALQLFQKDPEAFNASYDLIKGSAGVLSYEEVEVPESFSIKDEDEEEDVVQDEKKEAQVLISVKERRKLEGKIVAITPRVSGNGKVHRKDGVFLYEAHKLEVRPAEIDQFKQLYYATKDYEVLLMLAASLTRGGEPQQTQYYNGNGDWYSQRCTAWGKNAEVQLLQISKENESYFAQDWAHITTFFSSIDQGKITMDNKLVQWNTARMIDEQMKKLEFLTNYAGIDAQIALQYQELYTYWNSHYKDYKALIREGYNHATQEIFDSLLKHLDSVTELNVMSARGADEAAIGARAMELFPQDPNAGTIKDASGVDMKIYDTLNSLLEYAQPINTMLNMNLKLTDASERLSLDEELEIKNYIAHKNLSLNN